MRRFYLPCATTVLPSTAGCSLLMLRPPPNVTPRRCDTSYAIPAINLLDAVSVGAGTALATGDKCRNHDGSMAQEQLGGQSS